MSESKLLKNLPDGIEVSDGSIDKLYECEPINKYQELNKIAETLKDYQSRKDFVSFDLDEVISNIINAVLLLYEK